MGLDKSLQVGNILGRWFTMEETGHQCRERWLCDQVAVSKFVFLVL